MQKAWILASALMLTSCSGVGTKWFDGKSGCAPMCFTWNMGSDKKEGKLEPVPEAPDSALSPVQQ